MASQKSRFLNRLLRRHLASASFLETRPTAFRTPTVSDKVPFEANLRRAGRRRMSRLVPSMDQRQYEKDLNPEPALKERADIWPGAEEAAAGMLNIPGGGTLAPRAMAWAWPTPLLKHGRGFFWGGGRKTVSLYCPSLRNSQAPLLPGSHSSWKPKPLGNFHPSRLKSLLASLAGQ